MLPTIPVPQPVTISPAEAEATAVELRWNLSPFGERLRDLEITPDKQLPKREFLFRMLGKPCFPRGELVAVTGKAKSGKTYLCSALIAAHQSGNCLGIARISRPAPDAFPQRVLWIDTEQSEESTQEILSDRILPLSGLLANAAQVSVINMRPVSWSDRMSLIEAAVDIARPVLVIFDGIRDVVDDINKIAEAHEVVERLMQLASRFNACIVCVLHQNKAAEDHTLRGALGTELQNKAFEAYECLKEENRTFQVSQSFTRKYDIVDKLRFSVGDNGLPQLLAPVVAPRTAAEEAAPSAAVPSPESVYRDSDGAFVLPRLLRDVYGADRSLRASFLKYRIMQKLGGTIDDFFRVKAESLQAGLLVKDEKSPSEVYYQLVLPSPPE